ncbi:hypothetical protein, partial [Legionella qingyii]
SGIGDQMTNGISDQVLRNTHFERVDLLLKYNPDLNLKNKGTEQGEGQTALELAQYNLKQYHESGRGNKQIIESYSKIIDVLEKHLNLNTISNKN